MIIRINNFVYIFILVLIIFLVSACSNQTLLESESEIMEDIESLKSYEGKKILYIDSYHQGYAWSDGITAGIKSVLNETDVLLRIHRMDSKRNTDEIFKKTAALRAKDVIEGFKPDVVIVSDDNGFKYLVQEYYKDAELPFVYCGLNWDSSLYGAPYENTVGMVEIALTPELVERLKDYSYGERIGFIAGDTVTSKKTLDYYDGLFNLEFEKIYLVKTFDEFKEKYKLLQDEVDMILLENTAGIKGYSDDNIFLVEEFKEFVLENTKVPSGTTYDFVAPYTLIAVAKIPQEQGIWSANTALKILDGTKPSELYEVKNKEGELFVNMRIAEKLDIVFDPILLKDATRIE